MISRENNINKYKYNKYLIIIIYFIINLKFYKQK